MSTISGTCSESAAQVLFEQGLQEAQARRLQDQKEERDTQKTQVEPAQNLAEPGKGLFLNVYA